MLKCNFIGYIVVTLNVVAQKKARGFWWHSCSLSCQFRTSNIVGLWREYI